ncbi:MAG: cbb3-type cytochrome c oxidase subunit 3 [Steroidobacteraceae bacterium]
MSDLWGHLIGIVVTLLMLSFIGIWVWAWLPRHRQTFSRLAEIPMEDPVVGASNPMGNSIPAVDEDLSR